MKPSLCLNMIVKNEGERMARCLRSVLPHVKSVAILDTGSTDNTKEIIEAECKAHGVHYVIAVGEFVNFSQARNDAFLLAKDHNTGDRWCQFALMMDADMELVVEDEHAFADLNARAASLDMIQTGGALSYYNRRLVNLQTGRNEIYVGVTHEYMNVPADGKVKGARFKDNADGANRLNKYERDARLLEDGLKAEPDNGRYWYYLGNTYYDWGSSEFGKYELAIKAYQRRISMGGWDEETHQAMMALAHCYKATFEFDLFVVTMMDAFNFRPSRAEPLYELARYYRENSKPHVALTFAKRGVKIPRPDDALFVNDYIYAHGLRYEYAISGYYEETERSVAFQLTDDLALDPTLDADSRWSARSNLWWFLKPLKHYCPSFKSKQIDFVTRDGYTAMNPSVATFNDHLVCNIRTVNYKIDEHGRYMIGPLECNDAPIDTENFVVHLDDDLVVQDVREVVWERTPVWPMVTGLEDMRLVERDGKMWFNACVREQCATGTCQQWEGHLVYEDGVLMVRDAQALTDEHAIEKNWMPITGTFDYLYRLDKVAHRSPRLGFRDGDQIVIEKHPAKIHVGDISGGSQVIPFRAGWLCCVHEASNDPTTGKRTYWHRLAWLNHDFELRRLSLPFVFEDKQIEFCAGLAYHPNGNDLVFSYGVRDAEAHLATVSIEEAAHMIWKFHEN